MKMNYVLKTIRNKGFATMLLMTASMGIANAALILNVNAAGRLTGAQEVEVNFGGGNVELYDVDFRDGIYHNIFAATTGTGVIPVAANGRAEADAFAFALMNLVFIDSASTSGNFDSNARMTLGCAGSTVCNILTPYGILNSQFESLAFLNSNTDADDRVFNSPLNALNYSTGNNGEFTFAIWVPTPLAAVPEPATIGIMLLGLAGIVLRRRATA